MKKLMTVSVIVILLAVVFLGQWHWKNEIRHHLETAKAQMAQSPTDVEIEDTGGDNIDLNQGMSPTEQTHDLEKLTKNLPDSLRDKVISAANKQKPIQLVLAGGDHIQGLGGRLQQALDKAYGNHIFQVREIAFIGKNSLFDVYQGKLYQKITESKPDVVLFTSMLANDIGKVSTTDSARVPVLIGNELKKQNPSVDYLIEPSNPVTFNAVVNERVDKVKEEAQNNNIPYLDHMSRWPEGQDLSKVLKPNGSTPNKDGMKIWSDFLSDYFTGKKVD